MTPREPPGPDGLDPLIDTWPVRRPLYRVYTASRGLTGFNPTISSARFRPIFARLMDARVPVPTAYAARDAETALAEALLRGVDDAGKRVRLFRLEVSGLACGTIEPLRELRLVRLHGAGLKRLRLQRADLIDSEKEAYDWTARWAQALHDHHSRPDGLIWTSRQNDSSQALILWGDRVDLGDLRASGLPTLLDRDPGLDLVRQACLDAGIDFEA